MEENTKEKFKVVDASIVIAELMPDEKLASDIDRDFNEFVEGKLFFATSLLMKYEVANSLKSAILQKRLSLEVAQKFLKRLLSLPFIYFEVRFDEVLSLATKKNLSFYDASYVYLSQINHWPLLTLDKKLASL